MSAIFISNAKKSLGRICSIFLPNNKATLQSNVNKKNSDWHFVNIDVHEMKRMSRVPLILSQVFKKLHKLCEDKKSTRTGKT